MTTLVMPHNPAPTPDPMHPANGPIRYVAVRANLLPQELVAARRARALKKRVLTGLAAVLVVLIAWYAAVAWATSSARHDLTKARQQTTVLEGQQHKYDNLAKAQETTTAIKDALAKLMVGDLSWKGMLTTLRAKAPHAVVITGVTGTMTSGAAAASQSSGQAGIGVLNQTGQQQVGTLTINGVAPDKNAVAAYVDRLNKVTGLTAVVPASVTTTGPEVTFSINGILTTAALGGRYTPQPSATGGN